jgi:methionyl-tRNA formyltransferase
MANKLKVIFFGTPQFVVPILEAIAKTHEIIAVVTTPDQKVGRKQMLTASPVKTYALEHNIPVIQPEKLSEAIPHLSHLTSHLYVVAAYGKIIPKDILELPQYGAINIHPSLLPEYRGPTPIQTAVRDGKSETGISIMKMDEKMDHGPLLTTIPYPISEEDTSASLLDAVFAKSAEILPQVIEDYVSGEMQPKPQDDTKATYTKILAKEDGYIDIQTPPDTTVFDCMVRAYYPWPNVWTKVNIKDHVVRIKFLPRKIIQMEGKQPVSLKDFTNGYPELKESISKLFGS